MARPDPPRQEHARRQAKASDVLALFKSKPGIWIDWTELAKVGGGAAWRTRVSECRQIVKAEGGSIQNRQMRTNKLERDRHGDPRRLYLGPVISEYMYTAYVPIARPADMEPPDQMEMFR